LPAIIDLFTKEKVIQAIGREKVIQTLFPELSPEKVKKLIEIAKQLQSDKGA